jgi:hypothetical protein
LSSAFKLRDAPQISGAFSILIFTAVFCATVMARARVLASQDLYLHISIGRWILAHWQIPDHDIFSALHPAPWIPHEWLSGVGLAFVYDHFGWGAVVSVTAGFFAGGISIVAYETSRVAGPLAGLVVAILAWGLGMTHLVARPHTAALPLAAIWLAAHVRARSAGRAPPLYLLPLMTLWANLHGSFLFGLMFTALFAAEAIFESADIKSAVTEIRQWGVFAAASVLAAFITPNGVAGFWFPIKLMGMQEALHAAYEWHASSWENNAPLIVWCGLLLFIALYLGVRVPLCRLLMLMLLLFMAFAHRRHSELLGLSAPLLLRDTIAQSLAKKTPRLVGSWGLFGNPMLRRSFASAGLLCVAIAGFLACRNPVHPPDRYTPEAALRVVEASGVTGPVLNGYNFGGYLIFRGYGPFIDGRIDMYGRDYVIRYMSMHELTKLIDEYGIRWTLFAPQDAAIPILDNLTDWTTLYADSTAVIHVRKQDVPR